MKKTALLLCLLMMSLALLPNALASGALEPGTEATVVTNSGRLNLRQEPSTQARILKKLPRGGTVTVLESAGEWYKISSGGMEGYVHGDYLRPGSAEDAGVMGNAVASGDTLTHYVASHYTATPRASGGIRLYTEPTGESAYRMMLEVEQDDKLIVFQRAKSGAGTSWSLIQHGDISGWVKSADLDFSEKMETYNYRVPVQSMSPGVAYVGKGGAKLLKEANDEAAVLATIPEGTELEVSVRASGYCSASYGGQDGYVPSNSLLFGFVWTPGWHYEEPSKEELAQMEYTETMQDGKPPSAAYQGQKLIGEGEARGIARAALREANPDFSQLYERVQFVSDESSAFVNGHSTPYYQFTYSGADGQYYEVIVHGYTRDVLFNSDGNG